MEVVKEISHNHPIHALILVISNDKVSNVLIIILVHRVKIISHNNVAMEQDKIDHKVIIRREIIKKSHILHIHNVRAMVHNLRIDRMIPTEQMIQTGRVSKSRADTIIDRSNIIEIRNSKGIPVLRINKVSKEVEVTDHLIVLMMRRKIANHLIKTVIFPIKVVQTKSKRDLKEETTSNLLIHVLKINKTWFKRWFAFKNSRSSSKS